MKDKRKLRLALLSAVPLGVWGGWQVIEQIDYATSDDITRSDIDTNRFLRRFESTGDVKGIREWILHGPTEAPGTQMCITMGDWATEHKDQFVAIIESLPPKKRANFIETFAASLNQDSLQEFEAAFASDKTPSMQRILKTLATSRLQP